MIKKILKSISLILVVTIFLNQVVFGQEYLVPQEVAQPTIDHQKPAEDNLDIFINQTSGEFLEDTLSLTAVVDQSEEAATHVKYEYERYEFEDALDLMRPEYASSVIVKNLTTDNIKALLELSFEVGILVLHGEIVLFTSGSMDEIGILPAVRALTDKASFITHTHPGVHSAEGPSGYDINEASEAEEYVLTARGAYAYNNHGVLNGGSVFSYEEYLEKFWKALDKSSMVRSQTEARKDLNAFIFEQDRYNDNLEDRMAYRRGGTLSYTAGLSSSSVTTLAGAPRPYYLSGSTALTEISGGSDKVNLDFNVPNASSLSGFVVSFDDASTSVSETTNISSISNLVFGLKGPNVSAKLEIVDINGVKDVWTLTDISNSSERFYQLAVSAISNALDKTKISHFNFVVAYENTSVPAGTFIMRVKGMNLDVPERPVLTAPVPMPAYNNQTTINLTGSKEANTAIVINGVEVVARNSSTSWSATVSLTAEGNNSISIRAKNSIGKTSSQDSYTVKRDTLPPSSPAMILNGGAQYATSTSVNLTGLGASDSGSGLDKMSFSNDNINWSIPENIAAAKTHVLSSGDGGKTVYVKYFDKAGNFVVISRSIVLDTAAPTGSVVVNGGAQSISQTTATLTLSAADAGSGVDKMRFSSDGVNWTAEEPYVVTKSWTFSSGEGMKTVYVKFSDLSGRWSPAYSANVQLSMNEEKVLADGTRLFFESNVLVREVTPGNDQVFYAADGSVLKYRYSNGEEIRYLQDSTNKIQRVNAGGEVIELLDKPAALPLDETKAVKASFQGGMQAYYLDGVITELRTSSGIRITDFTLDENSEIRNGLISYPDGIKEIIRNGDLIRRIKADGNIQDFTPAHFPVREIALPVVQYAAFDKISQTEVRESKFFTHSGILSRYDDIGILREAKESNGSHYVYVRTQTATYYQTDLDLTLSSTPAPKSLIQAEYSLPGELKKMRLADGTQIFLENEKIVRVLDEENIEIEFSYSEGEELLSGLQVRREDALFQYDGTGFLSEVTTEAGTVHRTQIDSNGDGQITEDDEIELLLEAVNGNKLSDFELDSQGNILRGIIETREGIRQKIENGILTGFETVDGKFYEMRNVGNGREAVLKEWKLRDGTRVLYGGQTVSEIVYPDGRKLKQIALNSKKEIETAVEEHSDGTRKFFENGKMVRLITPGGVEITYGSDGLAERINFPDSDEQTISYKYAVDGALSEVVFKGVHTERHYSPDGVLLSLLSAGVNAEITDGEVTNLFTRFGKIETPEFDQGTLSGEVLFEDGSRQVISDGKLIKTIKADGTQVFYQNGIINAVETSNGRYEFVYSQNAGGNLSEARIRLASELGAPEYPLIPFLLDPKGLSMAPYYRDDAFAISGNANLDSGRTRFGYGSLNLDGAGDYFLMPDGSNSDFQYGSGDFTIDFWFQMESLDSQSHVLWSQYTGGAFNNNISIRVSPDNKLQAYIEKSGQSFGGTFAGSTTLEAGLWYHTALVRNGNTITLYLNGQAQAQHQVSGDMPSGNFSIGAGATFSGSGWGEFFKGAMDEIRISKGHARWTSEFTPPVQEYRRDAMTTRLYHFLTANDRAPADPALRSALLGRSAYDVLANSQLQSEISVSGQENTLGSSRFVEDPERGRVYEFSGNYSPVWTNLEMGQSAHNQGYISRSAVLDTADNLPALTSDLMDINGDDIADRVWMPASQIENYWWVQLGNGIGFEKPLQWTGVERRYDSNQSSIYGESQGSMRFFNGRRPAVLGDLADMNGDGLPDRVLQKTGGAADWFVQINNGHGFNAVQAWPGAHPLSNWSADTSYASEVRDDEGYGLMQPVVADLIDLDGDGRADRVIRPYVEPFGHWFYQHNNGNGFDDALLWEGVDSGFSSNPRTGAALSWYREESAIIADLSDLIDMNGDKRPDRLLLKLKNPANDASGYDWYVQLNNGDGFDAAILWDPDVRNMVVPGGKTGTALRLSDVSASGKRNIVADILDVTGDGLPDRVTLEDYSNLNAKTTWWVEINTGNGFAPAAAWPGIEGSSGTETALGQDDQHYRAFGPPSYGREPDMVRQVSDLADLNGDRIPDHIFFKESQGKWYVQYGTGTGFLPARETAVEALAAPSVTVPTSRYDYLHVSLKGENNLPQSAGSVRIAIGDPGNQDTYQEWNLSGITTGWQDFYLPLDENKSNAGEVKIEFLPSATAPQPLPHLYIDNLTFLILRPEASKDWLDRILAEETVLQEIDSESTQTLAEYLGVSQASEATPIDWNSILNAETRIDFNEEGEAEEFQTLYGSVSKLEDGRIVETTMPDGTRVVFESTTQTVTQNDGTVKTLNLNYGRVRTVERPDKPALAYSYEFDSQGNEITVIYDPETQTTEKYRDDVLILRQLQNGVVNTFTYDEKGDLAAAEISYKGRIYHVFQYQKTLSGNRLVKAEDGTVEEYDAESRIAAHTTPEGYHYSHETVPAQQAVPGSRIETAALPDGTTLSFTIPTVTLVNDPSGKMVRRVTLDAYTSSNGTQAVYDAGILKSAKLPDGTRIVFDRIEIKTEEDENGISSQRTVILDASIIHSDGTMTQFKNGRPWAVISATGHEVSLAEDEGQLINQNESAVFHQARAFRDWNEILMPAVQICRVPDTLPVDYEYEIDGTLLTRKFLEGSIELYEKGKLKEVFSEDGENMISYSYDIEGNPTSIQMGAVRRHLEMSVQKLRADVAVENEKALARLAEREQVIDQTIEGQYVTARDRLLAIRLQVQAQMDSSSAFLSKGKDAKKAVGDVAERISDAMIQVNNALENLALQRAEALKDLHSQVQEVGVKIQIETQASYAEITAETQKAQRSILRQEISPVVYHWYRKILGRDPSQAEYDALIGAADFQNGFNLQSLKDSLNGSVEKLERTAEVNAIKSRVQAEMEDFLSLSESQKQVYVQNLGIETGDRVALSASEADAILTWMQNQSLHFGQSAYLALEALLEAAGISFERVELASRLILIDILTGTLTSFESGDLVLSVYALKQTAKHYGLTTHALKMDYQALKVMYEDTCPNPQQVCDFRMIAHIDGNHFVIITKVTEDEITYIDPGKGPEENLEIPSLSKDEFTQIWINSGLKQSGYGVVLSSRAPPASIAAEHVQAMNTAEQMKVRGAFFGFLKKFFRFMVGAFFVSIDPIWALIVATSKSLREAILAHLESFENLFVDLFTFNFRDVFHKDIWKVFRTGIRVGMEILNGPIEKTGEALRKIGFSEKVAATIIAGAKIVVGVILTIYGGSGVGLIASGISDILNTHTNLSPAVKQIIVVTATVIASIAGGGADFNALKESLPYLAKEFAAAGVVALGDALGWDPRITALVTIPVRAAVGASVGRMVNGPDRFIGRDLNGVPIYAHDSRGLLEYVGDSVFSRENINSMASIGASIALDELGVSSRASGFLSVFIGQFAAGFVGGGSSVSSNYGQTILSRIGDGLKKFGQGVMNVAGSVISFGQKIVQGIGNFTVQGFKKAVSAFSSVFSRQTQEKIYTDETGIDQANVTADGDIWTWESGDSRIIYNSETGEVMESFGAGGTASITGLSQDQAGNFHHEQVTYRTTLGDGTFLESEYENNRLKEWAYYYGVEPLLEVKSNGEGWINSDGWMQNSEIEIYSPVFIDGSEELSSQPGYQTSFIFKVFGGKIAEASIELNQTTISNPSLPADTSKFVFGNGFNNDPNVPEGTSDEFMFSFINDLENKDRIINESKKLLIPLYERGYLIKNLADWAENFILNINGIQDVLKLAALRGTLSIAPIAVDILGQNNLVNEVKTKLINFENSKGILEKGIAFAHSGFLAPLLGAIEETRDDGTYFDINTVISYEGVAAINQDAFIDNPYLKRIINVWGTAPTAPVRVTGQWTGEFSENGSLVLDSSKKAIPISDFGPPTSTFENASFSARSVDFEQINIEIIGARHNDFSYDSDAWNKNPYWPEVAAKEINKKTNKFMRSLYEAILKDQNTPGRLNSFLNNAAGVEFDDIREVWVVNTSLLEFDNEE